MSVFDIGPFSCARKHIPHSDEKLLHSFLFQWICFQQFNLSILWSFLIKFLIFSSFFKTFVFFLIFFLASLAKFPHPVLIVCYWIVAMGNWMAFKILIERISISWSLNFFYRNYCLSIYEPMSCLKLGIGLLDLFGLLLGYYLYHNFQQRFLIICNWFLFCSFFCSFSS